jgi:signal peptidase
MKEIIREITETRGDSPMKKVVGAGEVFDAASDLEKQPSKGGKIANTVINVILVLVIVIAAVATYTSYVSTSGNGVPSIFGIRIMSIQTESMYDTLKPGDMIFDKAVKDTSALEIGDVITYWTVIDGERVLNTHRIVEIYDGGGYLIFETQGDNNTVADPLTVHESEIVGQWNGAKIGGLGKVFDYLQTSKGFLIVIVIPVALFFVYHLIQFFRVLFEYNNVKNKLRYEMERGKNEDIIDEERAEMEKMKKMERARLEAELREKLKAEILASTAPNAPSAEEIKEEPAPETPEEMEARIRAELTAEIEAARKS